MEHEKSLVELDEVLSHLVKEDLMKIPEDILKGIKDKKDKNYIWKYDETKELKEQNLNRQTIVMLSYLNMEYLLNDEQKELMKKIHGLNEKRFEEKKQEKYNPDSLFNNRKEIKSSDEINKEELAIVKYKESFIMQIINKFKGILKK